MMHVFVHSTVHTCPVLSCVVCCMDKKIIYESSLEGKNEKKKLWDNCYKKLMCYQRDYIYLCAKEAEKASLL